MHILHTTYTYAPAVDGVSHVVQHISKRLARRHEVHVATAAIAGSPREEIIDGVTVHRFGVEGNAVSGMHGEVPDFLAFIFSRRWDVIAMHGAHTWSFDALLDVLPTLPGKKVLVAQACRDCPILCTRSITGPSRSHAAHRLLCGAVLCLGRKSVRAVLWTACTSCHSKRC